MPPKKPRAPAKKKKEHVPRDDAFEKIRRAELVLNQVESLLAKLGFTSIERIDAYHEALKTIFFHGDETYICPFIRACKFDDNTDDDADAVPAETCFIFVAPHTKLRIDSVREYSKRLVPMLATVEDADKGTVEPPQGRKVWGIVLSYESPSTAATSLISQNDLPLQVLTFTDVAQLPMDHSLAPTVRPLSDEEVAALCVDLRIPTPATIPKMETIDVLCRLYNFPVGTVLRLQLPEQAPYYRLVGHPH